MQQAVYKYTKQEGANVACNLLKIWCVVKNKFGSASSTLFIISNFFLVQTIKTNPDILKLLSAWLA